MVIVTSLAEVWIEILPATLSGGTPSVTSLAEVWIEISSCMKVSGSKEGHFPCGSVD